MKSDAQPKPETVLIVDDDVRVVELLQITLGGRGYQVLAAYDGEGALKTIQRQRPAMIVMDVRLPRKSGFEVLDTVRRDPALRHLPVILISGDASTESRLQGLKLGADDYLAKPFSPRELIIKIRRILDRSQDHTLLLLKTEVLEQEIRRGRDVMLEMRQELTQNLSRLGSMLSQVAELNRYHSIEEVLERFVVTAVGSLDFERIVLLIADEDGVFRPRISRGIGPTEARSLLFQENGPLARMCISAARPLRADEMEGYPDVQDELLRLSAAGLTLVSPALQESRLRGLLGMGERRTLEPLGRFDYKLLEILGTSIVSALQNAQSFEETQRSFLETTAGLILNLEDRYPYIRGHSERVQDLALSMGKLLGLKEDELESLSYAARLHDLGQLEQYRELLDKAVVLSPSDRRLRRQRSAEHGAQLLGPSGNGMVGEIVRHHQEYWDGSGFPDGLRELEIPLGARLIALANAWDALTHDRPHRPAYSKDEAFRILRERAGRQFDPSLVPILVQTVEESLVAALSAG